MAYTEKYTQNMACHCEKCGVTDDKARLVIMSGISGSFYGCKTCLRDTLHLLEAEVTYPNEKWVMLKQDLVGWVKPGGMTSAEALRATMDRIESELKSQIGDFRQLKNGHTDRNKFIDYVKQMFKDISKFVEEYLNKTT